MEPADVSRVLREKWAKEQPDEAPAAPEPFSVATEPAPVIAPPKGIWGGYDSYAEYLKSPWWQRVREDALHRARNRCQLCSAQDHLDVHHNTYQRRGREWPEDVIVLCRECHKRHHAALPEEAA